MIYQLYFYVPESHVDKVKQALFDAGAGRYQGYEHCAWQTLGQGQFKPLANSQPFIGQVDKLETVAEYKVELICDASCLQAVLSALKLAHPYEQPAYGIFPLQAVFGDNEHGIS